MNLSQNNNVARGCSLVERASAFHARVAGLNPPCMPHFVFTAGGVSLYFVLSVLGPSPSHQVPVARPPESGPKIKGSLVLWLGF